ncbi:hypothetical protein ZIOFF_046277 [Zingiber officinale]|nr:hypothetical protein ZIOFF_046277 [Zingiber officinale]
MWCFCPTVEDHTSQDRCCFPSSCHLYCMMELDRKEGFNLARMVMNILLHLPEKFRHLQGYVS